MAFQKLKNMKKYGKEYQKHQDQTFEIIFTPLKKLFNVTVNQFSYMNMKYRPATKR